jgi:hypothetical protein
MSALDLGSAPTAVIYVMLDSNNNPLFSLTNTPDATWCDSLSWEPASDSAPPLAAAFVFVSSNITSISLSTGTNITILPGTILSVASTGSGSSGDPFTVNYTTSQGPDSEDPIIVVTPQEH